MLLWQEMFVPYFEAAKSMGWQYRLLLSDLHQNTKKRNDKRPQTQTRPYHFTMMGRVHDLDVRYLRDPLYSSVCY
jgi:hypothetical protein